MSTTLLDHDATVRVCVVAVGGEVFALDMAAVREVVVFESWTPVPLAPPHVLGVANLRGAVVPIVDAHARLGLPPRRAERRVRTLVVTAGGLEAAIVVDGVLALEAFNEVEPAPADAAHGWDSCITGLLAGRDGRVPLLDAARLLEALRPGPGPTSS